MDDPLGGIAYAYYCMEQETLVIWCFDYLRAQKPQYKRGETVIFSLIRACNEFAIGDLSIT